MSDTLDTSSLSQKLLTFGLTPVEAKMYLFLLNKPPKTIVEIARELALPRTSIYDNSEKLITKGLLAKVIEYKSQKLRALPIDILQSIIDEEKAAVESLEKSFFFLKENVSKSLDAAFNTEVKYYHGKQGFMQMMWNTLSAKEDVIRYPEFGRIEIVGKKFFHSWAEKIIEHNITERAIINPKQETINHFLHTYEYEKRSKYQQTHVLPGTTLDISGDTTIYNSTFALCFWKQGEIVGVEIENSELVKMQKSIFETLWKISKPFIKDK